MADPTLGNLTAGDVVSLTVYHTLCNQTCLNVLHYQAFDVTAGIDRWAAYASLYTEWSAVASVRERMLAVEGDNVTMERVRLQFLTPTRKLYRDFTINAGGTAGDGISSTANVAASILKQGDGSGRQFVGRLQVVGPPTASQNNGVWNVGYMADLEALALELKQDLVVAGVATFRPVLIGQAAGEAVPHVHNVVECWPQNTVRVMRRRTVGLGI